MTAKLWTDTGTDDDLEDSAPVRSKIMHRKGYRSVYI